MYGQPYIENCGGNCRRNRAEKYSGHTAGSYDKGCSDRTVDSGILAKYYIFAGCRYQEKDLWYIIRQELTHCACRDTQAKLLFVIISAVHWFNPFVWLMKYLANQDMELACDEKVLENTSKKERSEYGEVLMSCIGTDKFGGLVLSTEYAQGVKFIKKRFRNIFDMREKSGKVVVSVMIVLLIAVSA